MADQMLIPLRNRAAGRTEGIKRESRRSMFSLFVEFKVKVCDIVLEPEGDGLHRKPVFFKVSGTCDKVLDRRICVGICNIADFSVLFLKQGSPYAPEDRELPAFQIGAEGGKRRLILRKRFSRTVSLHSREQCIKDNIQLRFRVQRAGGQQDNGVFLRDDQTELSECPVGTPDSGDVALPVLKTIALQPVGCDVSVVVNLIVGFNLL